MFSQLGEERFDDYWMNFNKITVADGEGGPKKINNLMDFVRYRNGDTSKILPKNSRASKR